MLGKQAWRLINHPNSLLARTFKAKYYANTTFLDANLGSNPSFIWRSILETQTTIKRRSRWRVGDGTSINIWNDPWLPNPANPYVRTPTHSHANNLTVSSLIVPSSSSWNNNLISSLFDINDQLLIRNIPLPDTKVQDKLIWMEDSKGAYTVKSCY